MMDNIGKRGSGRQKSDHHTKISDSSWSMVHQHQLKEQNAMNINKKILNIIAERDAALDERDRALLEKKKAMEERDAAISQKNVAIRERNDAMLDRDNAIEALRNAMNHRLGFGGGERGIKRTTYHQSPRDAQVLNDFDREIAVYEGNNSNHLSKRAKGNEPRSPSSVAHKPKKEKILGEDLNKRAGCEGFKLRNNWDAKDLGLNIVCFDETTMPLPGCSCTGEFKNCYKWGNGGWQSSCCTTTLSCYPLPPMPNKRYARMAGRKMSGSVFTRLLSRLASEGYDLSVPVDLKDHWSKHGTNRYITIK